MTLVLVAFVSKTKPKPVSVLKIMKSKPWGQLITTNQLGFTIAKQMISFPPVLRVDFPLALLGRVLLTTSCLDCLTQTDYAQINSYFKYVSVYLPTCLTWVCSGAVSVPPISFLFRVHIASVWSYKHTGWIMALLGTALSRGHPSN